MIISASYKTDIPTFYGTWFMNRLRTGHCCMVNPYNQQAVRVSLRREDVDGIVFWTKNLGPFRKHLDEVRDRGYPFLIQYAINGYPRELESAVVDSERSVSYLQEISARFGKRVGVWRYDTIIYSSLTPRAFHLENFDRLASRLAASVDEVVISFAQLYRKTLRNMTAGAEANGFTWSDPSVEEKRSLMRSMVQIASRFGIKVSLCAQRELLIEGVADAHCVDVGRLSDVAGRHIEAKLKGSRKTCGCYASRDIGDYDTCPHGCVYCYAVSDRERAKRRYQEHDPESEFLFQPPHLTGMPKVDLQLPLFPADDSGNAADDGLP